MSLIKTAGNWTEAFDEADKLLAKDQLTAISVVSKTGYMRGTAFVATHLAEFGDPQMTLNNLRAVCPQLHGNHIQIELWHGPHPYIHAGEAVQGWLLSMVYPG